MSQMIEGPRKTYLAAAAIGVNLRVKITDGTTTPPTINVAGATDASIGVTEAAVLAASDPVAILLANAQGTRKMHATEAITSGNTVYAAADGKVASSGSVVEGIAQETTTANGDIFEVLTGRDTENGTVITRIVPMIENATNTIHTATVPLPAGSVLLNIQAVNTVLWTAASASLVIGDDDDPNGFLEATDCKATDLLVGEVFDISNAENWAGNNGAYLVAATGRKGSVASGNSGIYYGTANNIIAVMTVGTPATTAGRTFIAVTYTVPVSIAAVATGP